MAVQAARKPQAKHDSPLTREAEYVIVCTYLAVEEDVAGAEALIPRDSKMELVNTDQEKGGRK